jgi:hypothetical protein
MKLEIVSSHRNGEGMPLGTYAPIAFIAGELRVLASDEQGEWCLSRPQDMRMTGRMVACMCVTSTVQENKDH